MAGLRPGWLVALCATGLTISSWLPWLTTSARGGGRANAIGGTLGSIALPPRFGAGQLIVLLSSVLGPDIEAGQHPQLLVPGGHWQRARPDGNEPSLVSCIVVPGFDFADFSLDT